MRSPIIPETVAVEAFSSLIKGCTDYLACREQEKTERERIGAVLEVALAQINAQFDLYKQAMENSHKQFLTAADLVKSILSMQSVTEEMTYNALQFLQNVYYKTSDERMQSLQNALATGQDFGMRRLK